MANFNRRLWRSSSSSSGWKKTTCVLLLILCCLGGTSTKQPYCGVLAFVSNPNDIAILSKSTAPKKNSRTFGPVVSTQRSTIQKEQRQQQLKQYQQSLTQLYFMGSDGGILGIGTPELLTILLVGYFVLGPSDLYKLVKEIGKFVQNFQTFTSEATASIENNLESQLQLDEIRKAQRELTDAFSFRRSINVDEDTDAFEINAQSPRTATATAAVVESMGETAVMGATVAGAATNGEVMTDSPKKKIRRRRVKRQPPTTTLVEGEDFNTPPSLAAVNKWSEGELANDVPDLALDDSWFTESEEAADKALREANEELRKEAMELEAEERRKERIQRLQGSIDSQQQQQQKPNEEKTEDETATADAASARFAAQLSGNWNSEILAKEEKLSPLANIMERLALLEEEKLAADERLQEEFRLREENEERFYREKRKLLEEAAAQVQADVYNI